MDKEENLAEELLKSLMEKKDQEAPEGEDMWSKIIKPKNSYLLLGDVGQGKSGLAYYLLERFSEEYNLRPATVGIPEEKHNLLPSHFERLASPADCTNLENAIVLIDEADIQLPMDDRKMKEFVINFLSLPRHRKQIFLLAFHFPRLVMGTYLPFFAGFLLKRPPYLMEFATKEGSKAILGMMQKAEERFSEMTSELEVQKNTYVVAPRLRWQGIVQNPLATFWTEELSEIWSGVGVTKQGDRLVVGEQFKLSSLLLRQNDDIQSNTYARLGKLQHLFPEGVPYDTLIEMDRKFTLDELRGQCITRGLPTSGDKKALAGKIVWYDSRQEGEATGGEGS